MIDATERVPLDADLDAVLAIDDADRLALCDRCLTFVDIDDSGESELTGETICLACFMAEEAEQAAMRADVEADLDALHDAAARYRAAGIDPQLAFWLARHDGRRA